MKLIDLDAKEPYLLDGRYKVIPLIRCEGCKYGEPQEDFEEYECMSSGCGLVNDHDFFCADAVPRASIICYGICTDKCMAYKNGKCSLNAEKGELWHE